MAFDSENDICNMALSHLGSSATVSDLDNGTDALTIVCREFFDTARDKTQRDFPWPFTRQIVELTLVEEDPNSEWNYSYRYPSECLFFRRILGTGRNPDRQARIPYHRGRDNDGRLIFTDAEDACAEISKLITDPGEWDADYGVAFSYLLASFIAPRAAVGELKKPKEMLELYDFHLRKAAVNARTEEQDDEAPEGEFASSRV